LLELSEQAVDFLYRDAGAGGNAALARCFEQFGFGALPRRHRIDDALDAPYLFIVHLLVAGNLRELARQFVEQRGDASHFLHLADLLLEIFEIESFA
jgi:hypothetical protein